MSSSLYDVCAIGNALVDVIADASDAFLEENGIAKGGMTLIDATRAAALYEKMGQGIEMSGGSAGNTVAGVASFGGRAAYIGKVKNDQLGTIYRHDMRAQGVHFATAPAPDSNPTGRCLILVTPDAQRSMNTYLGAAVELTPEDLEADVLRASQVTYLEGYLFDPPEAKKAFREAARIARASGRKIALTLSDVFCVERHRAEFLDLLSHHVDILFANQNEVLSLYQTQDLDHAIANVRTHVDLSITTRGEKGAILCKGAQTVEVSAAPVAKVVDTTGAGDLFAAGFLYGWTNGKDLAESGHLGALAAAEIISHYGPRPQKALKDIT